jgi:hypothetical protein
MTLANHLRSEEKWKLRELEESMEVKWFAAYRTGGVNADTDEAAEYSRARDAYYAEWKRYHSRHQEIQSVPVRVVIDRAAKRLGQRRKAAPSLAISSVQLQPAQAEPSVPGPVDHNASGGVDHRKGKNLHTIIIREYSVETNGSSRWSCIL